MASLSENQYDPPTTAKPMASPMKAPPRPNRLPTTTRSPPSPASRTVVFNVLRTPCITSFQRQGLLDQFRVSHRSGWSVDTENWPASRPCPDNANCLVSWHRELPGQFSLS